MARKPTLGAAGSAVLRARKGADALAAATQQAPAARAERWKVITARLTLDDYRWLRQQAHNASMDTGLRADASAVIRRLIRDAQRAER
jgi:hypothetical protein